MTYPFEYWYPAWRVDRLNRWSVRVITQPTVEPIGFALAAMHLRLDSIDSPPVYEDQTLVEMQISAAREFCENYLGRSLAPQLLEWRGSRFSTYPEQSIFLPMGPVISVESVIYIDEAGTEITIDPLTYMLDDWIEPAQLQPIYSGQWPTSRVYPGSVRVRYHAGYTGEDDSPNDNPLPFSLKAAMLLTLTDLYDNRGNSTPMKLEEIPNGAKVFMRPYRLEVGFA